MSGRSAVVVAHPDDEILWLSSAMAAARHVVLCYGAPFGKPAKAAARRRAVAALRLPSLVNLAIPESGTRLLVDWRHPVMTPTGMGIADPDARQRYDDNFNTLLAELRPVLAGCADVYTHNPWGEYGHPEHIQVYRAVTALQAELGYTVWFSNYTAPLTWPLAQQSGGRALLGGEAGGPPGHGHRPAAAMDLFAPPRLDLGAAASLAGGGDDYAQPPGAGPLGLAHPGGRDAAGRGRPALVAAG